MILLKWILKNKMADCETDFCGSRWTLVNTVKNRMFQSNAKIFLTNCVIIIYY